MLLIEKALNKANPEKGPESSVHSEIVSHNSFVDEIKTDPQVPSNIDFKYLTSSEIQQIVHSPNNQQRELLAKLEELENENASLHKQVDYLSKDKDSLKVRIKELVQDLNKKNEELQILQI